jgi:cytosine/uracil/thiamine/allantoin permease
MTKNPLIFFMTSLKLAGITFLAVLAAYLFFISGIFVWVGLKNMSSGRWMPILAGVVLCFSTLCFLIWTALGIKNKIKERKPFEM